MVFAAIMAMFLHANHCREHLALQIEADEQALIGSVRRLTENCRGRAVKHHTAPHWSTGLQIEAHEQNSKMAMAVPVFSATARHETIRCTVRMYGTPDRPPRPTH